ncbi:hypothetical protein ERX35_008015 [Macrococcus equipercicus]|uniref:Uncharacterized protein n=1 Tax=Macrococcus equipercicus TaxID=69967 RepID=A0ABQ6R7S3_9STAP|nr:hypothetical protein [Macrococcus equipercicus]KAA1039151.1 hypothetical protein ERX35_008015 [Macrococcus equipercicus]
MHTQLRGRGLVTLSITLSTAAIIALYIMSYFIIINPVMIPGAVILANALGLPILMWLVVNYFKGGERR